MRKKIPGGSMSVAKARARWEAVRVAAQFGDPAAMLDAVSRFETIAEMILSQWGDGGTAT